MDDNTHVDILIHFKGKVIDVFSLFGQMTFDLQLAAVRHLDECVGQWKETHIHWYRKEVGTQTTGFPPFQANDKPAQELTNVRKIEKQNNSNEECNKTTELTEKHSYNIDPDVKCEKSAENENNLQQDSIEHVTGEMPSFSEEEFKELKEEKTSDAETEIYDDFEIDSDVDQQTQNPVKQAPKQRRERRKKTSKNTSIRTVKKKSHRKIVDEKKTLSKKPKTRKNSSKHWSTEKARAKQPKVNINDLISDDVNSEEQRTCTVCNRILSSPQVLQEHLRIHSGEMPYSCTEPGCSKTFRQASALYVHRKKAHCTVKPFVCDQCNFAAHYKFELTSHVQRFHIKSRDFLCSNCGKGFISKQCLRIHEKGHSGKRYHCKKCNFSTHAPTSLEAHIRNIHATGKKFICEVCGASMKYQSSYSTHMRKHYGVKPFKCQFCTSCFASSSQQMAHIKRVHKPSSMECDICRKKFSDKHNLQRHKVIHRELKPFSCPRCSHKTNYPCNMRKHCLSKHKMVYPPKIYAKVKEIADIDISGSAVTKTADVISRQSNIVAAAADPIPNVQSCGESAGVVSNEQQMGPVFSTHPESQVQPQQRSYDGYYYTVL